MCSPSGKILGRFFGKIFAGLIFLCALCVLILPAFTKCNGECSKVSPAPNEYNRSNGGNGGNEGKTFVSISPAMTEIMYAIGAEHSLVAVSNYCTYPEGAKNKEKIGSNYSINEEKILKLKPDYILALDISEALLDKFKRLKITPLCFKYPDIQSIHNNILTLGTLTGHEKEAKGIVEFSKKKINEAKGKAQGKRVLYLVQTRPMITIGKKSFITDVIEQSGNHSATAGLSSHYPVILEEYAIKLKPDIVVLGAFTDKKDVEKYFPKTPIVKMSTEQNDIINRPGPRIYKSVEFFSSL